MRTVINSWDFGIPIGFLLILMSLMRCHGLFRYMRAIVDIKYVKKFKRWLKRKGILRDEDEDKNQTNGPEGDI